jgi:hypothetical protein
MWWLTYLAAIVVGVTASCAVIGWLAMRVYSYLFR